MAPQRWYPGARRTRSLPRAGILPVVADELEDLVAAASRGEEPALDALVVRNMPKLHAFVRLRMGAQLRAREGSLDVVQSICRTVLGDLPSLEYRGEREFLRWLFTAALNKLREHGRFHARERRDPDRERHLEPEALTAYASVATPSRVAIGAEDVERIEGAFDRLPDDYREVITLSRIVGLAHREIAEQIGRTEGATRTLLGRALAKLADELERDGPRTS
jgi:RNA polymerase sigma-70 factor (ECF subfamily)